jgi:hypothetical protein
MHIGLMNVSVDFQGYINNAIREALPNFILAYLNDILLLSNWENEHVEHVMWVMQHLLEAGLHLKPETCHFHQETLRYLGFITLATGTPMDEDKGKALRNCSGE